MAPDSASALREQILAELAEQVRQCPRCPVLVASRTQPVFGAGSHSAEIFLVGEAPGQTEDRRGEPFVGAAGRVLNRILESLGVNRADLFITNVVKCHPPNNRKPLPGEIANCRPYLETQIATIRPRILGALGATAAAALIGTSRPVRELRGNVHRYQERPVICTYHPAYVFRNPEIEDKIREDLAFLVEQWRKIGGRMKAEAKFCLIWLPISS